MNETGEQLSAPGRGGGPGLPAQQPAAKEQKKGFVIFFQASFRYFFQISYFTDSARQLFKHPLIFFKVRICPTTTGVVTIRGVSVRKNSSLHKSMKH